MTDVDVETNVATKNTKKGENISIILGVLVVIITIIAGVIIFNLNQKVDLLNAQYNTLDGEYKNLSLKYDKLVDNNNKLEGDYNILKASNERLKNDYERLKSSNSYLSGQLASTQQTTQSMDVENKRLRDLLAQYERVPSSYYTTSPFQKHPNTFTELHSFLTNEFELPKGYVLNIFDCSESSAYLEWALDNAGFDANIVTGKTPWGGDGYHAWVIVHNTDMTAAVEATALTGGYIRKLSGKDGIVRGGDVGANNYYNGYDNSFDNIYLAVKGYGNTEQWNWWEGYWGFI